MLTAVAAPRSMRMRTTKKMVQKFLAVTVFVAMSLNVFGQSIQDFEEIVDFDFSIRELSRAAEGSGGDFPDRLVIIDGTVSARYVLDANRDTYVGQLELVGGEWLGVEEVVTYRCILLLQGTQFANAIPARRSRTKHPDEIDLNSRLLVVGTFLRLFDMEDGTTVPILDAFHIRKID